MAEVAAAVTTDVMMVNVALVEPAPTVTFAGTVATEGLLLANATTTPPLGAAPVSVTVPVEVFPPARLAGLSAKVESAGGLIVNVADLLPVPKVAVRTTRVWTVTG